ncbi:peptide deformylase [Clostridium autoethanogenum]|uniref:Peptide deformylase n=1 Tax=Clostridium autoethanogenum DSM 10061 TaxID=1341692 RepID=A0ABN4BJ78_9CLOT|nr:peptide deformylase [Clostridium autoethanogenum]AGY77649.1 peptide deformylase [Clostridium autoethanogenum DSM 10061]ALU37788.1 Peptide deformylase [Clostridium autoethanogenum DSM 10061]OVY49861.1 Peptide deformylase [Clostridium autoethanogenum]
MALRNIRTLGDEILRKKCRAVEKVDDRILTLLKDMADTLHNTENGAAIAAPQVGVLRRAVVIDMGEGIIYLVNPEIIEEEGSQEVIEGCLSIPNKWGKLIRPAKVKVKALNEKGEEFTITGEGDLAKCLCHEIEHLDGILFIDKVTEFIE